MTMCSDDGWPVLPCGHPAGPCASCDYEWAQWADWLREAARWERAGIEFAVSGGAAVHVLGSCVGDGPGSFADWQHGYRPGWPLTRAEAGEWLRASHERRPCRVCQPRIDRPAWVKVGRRWRLAE